MIPGRKIPPKGKKNQDEKIKMYEKNPEMPDGRRFLGVAFYNHQYKKLVADKVFLRSEEL